MVSFSHNSFPHFMTTLILNLDTYNALNSTDATDLLHQCCTAGKWIEQTLQSRPHSSFDHLLASAEHVWESMGEADWLEAFDGHPKIGDPASLKKKYHSTLHTASSEQSGVNVASDEVIQQLALVNQQYLDKFGFIFIICATGKSAEEMLQSITDRIGNKREQELAIAAAEQWKITLIRLNNLFSTAK